MLNRIKLYLMKFLKISFLLFFCLAINAVTVDTGHANVSLVKFENVKEGKAKLLLVLEWICKRIGIPTGKILVIQEAQ